MVGESIVATSARNVMTMALDLTVTSRVSSTPARADLQRPPLGNRLSARGQGDRQPQKRNEHIDHDQPPEHGRTGGLLRARSSAAMPNPNHAASGVRTTARHTAHTNAATRRNLGSTACTKERPWAKGSSNIRADA